MLNKFSIYTAQSIRIGLVKRLVEDSMVEEYWAFKLKKDLLTDSIDYLPIVNKPGYYHIEQMESLPKRAKILTTNQLAQVIKNKNNHQKVTKASSVLQKIKSVTNNYTSEASLTNSNNYVNNEHPFEKVKKIS
ncbi:MAG: hypothetical protein RSB99_00290 [Bacilli bacterium]